jgi:alkanesulfonate monooxygenase SsuD/methylene tetrahydromethanopterin reductase-like flavin-dependent oxidoreductase (luciferase family)
VLWWAGAGGRGRAAGDPRILRARRRFRFGLGTGRVETAGEFSDAIRRADASGYDVLLIPDHLGVLSPEVAMMAAAERSDRLRIGSSVSNNDLRHAGGRLEVGLGAGGNAPENEAAGIHFDRGGIRVLGMVEESARNLRRSSRATQWTSPASTTPSRTTPWPRLHRRRRPSDLHRRQR